MKLALTRIHDLNRSTSSNSVHVNGRLLYIVDWRMVVVEGEKCTTPCKKEGEIVGEGKCPVEYVRGNMLGGMSRSPPNDGNVTHGLD